MTALDITPLLTASLSTFGAKALIILATFLGLAVAFLVFRWGMRHIYIITSEGGGIHWKGKKIDFAITRNKGFEKF